MRAVVHIKAMWALLWRAMLLAPFIFVLGAILFSLVLALTLLPAFTIALLVMGEYWWALATIPAWLAWLKWGGPVRAFVFEGFEWAGL